MRKMERHFRAAVDQAVALGEMLGMQAHFGDFMPYQGGEYGMAVLSRWPVVSVTNHRLPDGEQTHFQALDEEHQTEDHEDCPHHQSGHVGEGLAHHQGLKPGHNDHDRQEVAARVAQQAHVLAPGRALVAE